MRRAECASGTSGSNFEAFPGPVQFKLRTPQALSHVLGRRAPESSAELRGAPGSSGELGSGPLA
eukprot:13067938-Alexandrium_andersonii.AAC.1